MTLTNLTFKTITSFVLHLKKCRQLYGLLEVGYTIKTVEDLEVVVHKRNLTIGVGCICAPLVAQRFYQHDKLMKP